MNAAIDDIVRRRRAGELITRAENELVMGQFEPVEGLALFNPTQQIAPEYLAQGAPTMLSWPPHLFKDEP